MVNVVRDDSVTTAGAQPRSQPGQDEFFFIDGLLICIILKSYILVIFL